MIKKKVEANKIFFRKIIILMVFTVILTGIIPSVFDKNVVEEVSNKYPYYTYV